ncbi:Uncharacterised protein [Mycobacteroides abscessus subsp. bolletii]|uniref:hypothetical protein n=1 Tax=Mycobacteroides abscessus TaxID=36809 RepID=UPI0009A86017|nr:hypothetical protein [Mycobacteroides abscessus]SKZ03099.1 Uncharacterised protein [Mycobacteroides abscessus subsp. bolletii]
MEDYEQVYGLESEAPKEPAPAPEVMVESAPVSVPAKAPDSIGEQPDALSPTAQAAARLSEIRARRGRPVSSAVTNAGPDADTPPSAVQKQGRKRGLFASVIGAADDDSESSARKSAKRKAVQKDRDAGNDTDEASENEESGDADPQDKAGSGRGNSLLRPRHLIALASAVGVVLVVSLAVTIGVLSGGGTEQPLASTTGGGASTTTSTAALSTRDKPLPIEVAQTDGRGNKCPAPSSDVANAFSPDKTKALTCTRAWNADGAQFTFTLPGGPYVISEVRLKPGYDWTDPETKTDQWELYRIVHSATWRFDVGKPVEQVFNGSRRQQSKRTEGIISSTVTLTITKTSPPSPAAPTASSTGPTFGIPGGFGSIPLPGIGSPGQTNAHQNPGALTAFAFSDVQIMGHRA